MSIYCTRITCRRSQDRGRVNEVEAIFAEIWNILLDSYTEYGAFVWMASRNSHLDNSEPITVINQGHGRLALEAALAIEGGIVMDGTPETCHLSRVRLASNERAGRGGTCEWPDPSGLL